jgi:hypothetical protein
VNAQLFPDVTAGLIEDMYEYDAQNRKPEAVPTYRRLISVPGSFNGTSSRRAKANGKTDRRTACGSTCPGSL